MKDTDLEILYGLAEGKTEGQIARDLGLSMTVTAVSNRVRYMRRFYGARTSAQLIAEAYHRGILKAPKVYSGANE